MLAHQNLLPLDQVCLGHGQGAGQIQGCLRAVESASHKLVVRGRGIRGKPRVAGPPASPPRRRTLVLDLELASLRGSQPFGAQAPGRTAAGKKRQRLQGAVTKLVALSTLTLALEASPPARRDISPSNSGNRRRWCPNRKTRQNVGQGLPLALVGALGASGQGMIETGFEEIHRKPIVALVDGLAANRFGEAWT